MLGMRTRTHDCVCFLQLNERSTRSLVVITPVTWEAPAVILVTHPARRKKKK